MHDRMVGMRWLVMSARHLDMVHVRVGALGALARPACRLNVAIQAARFWALGLKEIARAGIVLACALVLDEWPTVGWRLEPATCPGRRLTVRRLTR